ncbi:MAG: GNAT family N-acetyltransferase [Pleurocapsa sp.]
MKLIKLLDGACDRNSFDCGNEALNGYLRAIARQHNKKGVSRTFILVDSAQPQTIIGFFTLVLCEIRAVQLPKKWSKKYPTTIAGVKLARLAVDKKYQRQGIGEILMVEAMKRALIIADNAGVIGLFVDAKDEAAKKYYQRYDFISFIDNPLSMFLPLATIKEIL